jgi:hypothetical protein
MNNEQEALEYGKPDTMGIDMGNLIQEFNLSKSYVYQYTQDFVDLDQLVDGVSINKDPDTPFVADTTLSGLVRSIPRASLQQLPVFGVVVNGTKNSKNALICSYLLKKTAFNEDTFGKGLLSTLQIGAEQALTHGYAPFLVTSGSMYNDFGTTMRLIDYHDTSPEPGISDANESGYHYIIAHLTPGRVRKILRDAKADPNTRWNIPALEMVLASGPRATEYSPWQSDPRKNAAGEAAGPTYAFVTRYPVGSPEEDIVTFCPEYSEAPLRVMEITSKWAYPRVQYLVIDPAPLTPFGISRVRLASPNQNLMNIYYGNIAAMLLLNSAPPILKRGRFLKPVQLKRNAVWETLDQNASADLKTMDNGALANFVQMAQQFASQIQNIMGSPTGTINGNSNSQGFSKTAPGVKMAQEVMDTANKQVTNILENFLRQYALVALDTLLSEQTGEDWLIVDDETKDQINQIEPGAVGPSNKIGMNWERFYAGIEEWSVEIDVSLSPDELEDQKHADLQDLLVVLAQNAQDLGPAAVEKVREITDMLLKDKAPLIKPMGPIAPMGIPGGMPGQPAAPAVPAQAQLPGQTALTV